MKRGRLLALLVLPILAACGGDGGDGTPTPTPITTGRLTIHLVLPPSPDPVASLDGWRATVFDATGGTVTTGEFGLNDEIRLGNLGTGAGFTFLLEGLAAGATVSRGTTLPFDLAETFDQTASLYFAQIDTFSDVGGTAADRAGGAVARLSDGRVLIAGGTVGGAPVDTAEIYDPRTDTVSPAGAMSTEHAGVPAVVVLPDAILVAGGQDAGNTPTDVADLFVYDAAAGTGAWQTMPAMSRQITEFAAVPIGNGRVLVAGGGDPGLQGPRAETEVFTWDGASGSWQPGPDMAVARMRLFGFSEAPDEAFVGGGFTDQGGANIWNDGVERYVFNAGNGGNLMAGGTLGQRRGAAGQVALPGGTYLLLGGRSGAQSALQDSAEELSVSGTNVQGTAAGTLPSAREFGGGGVLADGRVLVLGGSDGTSIDEALVYDPAADTFTPHADPPGPTASGTVVPLPDGTSLVVIDGRVTRYNP